MAQTHVLTVVTAGGGEGRGAVVLGMVLHTQELI